MHNYDNYTGLDTMKLALGTGVRDHIIVLPFHSRTTYNFRVYASTWTSRCAAEPGAGQIFDHLTRQYVIVKHNIS